MKNNKKRNRIEKRLAALLVIAAMVVSLFSPAGAVEVKASTVTIGGTINVSGTYTLDGNNDSDAVTISENVIFTPNAGSGTCELKNLVINNWENGINNNSPIISVVDSNSGSIEFNILNCTIKKDNYITIGLYGSSGLTFLGTCDIGSLYLDGLDNAKVSIRGQDIKIDTILVRESDVENLQCSGSVTLFTINDNNCGVTVTRCQMIDDSGDESRDGEEISYDTWKNLPPEVTFKRTETGNYCLEYNENSVSEYTLTYNCNGGTYEGKPTYTPQNKKMEITSEDLNLTPTRSGYEFAGWYTDDTLTTEAEAGTMSKDTTIYAGWKKEISLTKDDNIESITGAVTAPGQTLAMDGDGKMSVLCGASTENNDNNKVTLTATAKTGSNGFGAWSGLPSGATVLTDDKTSTATFKVSDLGSGTVSIGAYGVGSGQVGKGSRAVSLNELEEKKDCAPQVTLSGDTASGNRTVSLLLFEETDTLTNEIVLQKDDNTTIYKTTGITQDGKTYNVYVDGVDSGKTVTLNEAAPSAEITYKKVSLKTTLDGADKAMAAIRIYDTVAKKDIANGSFLPAGRELEVYLDGVEAGTMSAGGALTLSNGQKLSADGEGIIAIPYYTVTFNDGGADYGEDTLYAPQYVLIGNKAVKPKFTPTYVEGVTNASKANKIFAFWSADSENYNFETSVTSQLTLKEIWQDVNEADFEVKYTFDGIKYYYAQLSDAIDKTKDKKASIFVLKNATLAEDKELTKEISLTVPEGKTVTLDSGKKLVNKGLISCDGTISELENQGSLEVGAAGGVTNLANSGTVDNGGTIGIVSTNSGTITNTRVSSESGLKIGTVGTVSDNSGTITGGVVTTLTNSSEGTVSAAKIGTVESSGGTLASCTIGAGTNIGGRIMGSTYAGDDVTFAVGVYAEEAVINVKGGSETIQGLLEKVDSTVTLKTDLIVRNPVSVNLSGDVTLELNGHMLRGADGAETQSGNGGDGVSPITVTPGSGVLTVQNTNGSGTTTGDSGGTITGGTGGLGNGGDGGNGGHGIVVAGSKAKIIIKEGVTVSGGSGGAGVSKGTGVRGGTGGCGIHAGGNTHETSPENYSTVTVEGTLNGGRGGTASGAGNTGGTGGYAACGCAVNKNDGAKVEGGKGTEGKDEAEKGNDSDKNVSGQLEYEVIYKVTSTKIGNDTVRDFEPYDKGTADGESVYGKQAEDSSDLIYYLRRNEKLDKACVALPKTIEVSMGGTKLKAGTGYTYTIEENENYSAKLEIPHIDGAVTIKIETDHAKLLKSDELKNVEGPNQNPDINKLTVQTEDDTAEKKAEKLPEKTSITYQKPGSDETAESQAEIAWDLVELADRLSTMEKYQDYLNKTAEGSTASDGDKANALQAYNEAKDFYNNKYQDKYKDFEIVIQRTDVTTDKTTEQNYYDPGKEARQIFTVYGTLVLPNGMEPDNKDIVSVEMAVGQKASQAAPTGLKTTKASSHTAEDGTIYPVDDTMEYRLKTEGDTKDWIPVPQGQSQLNLPEGIYQVRYRETDDKRPSDSVDLTVGAKEDQAPPKIESFTPHKATGEEQKDGSIDVSVDETKKLEYSTDNGVTWTSFERSTEKDVIEPLGKGDILIRYPGDEDHNPSETISVTVGVKENQEPPEGLTPIYVSDDGVNDGGIRGVTDEMEYRDDNTDSWKPVTVTYEDPENMIGPKLSSLPQGIYHVRFKGDEDKNPSPEVVITIGVKEEQEPPEDIVIHKTSGEEETDGSIDNVDETMEYSTDQGETWNPVPEGETKVEGLGKGEVWIRKKEDDTHGPGEPVKKTVNVKTEQEKPNPDNFTPHKATGEEQTDGSIDVSEEENKKLEYSTDNGETWTPFESSDGIDVIKPLGSGVILIRYPGDEDQNPSEAISVMVGVKADQEPPEGLVPIRVSATGAVDGGIRGVTNEMEYSEGSTDIGAEDTSWKPVIVTYEDPENEEGPKLVPLSEGIYWVRFKGDEDKNPSPKAVVIVGVKEPQEAPELTEYTNVSGEEAEDGTISGVDETMEYSLDGGKTWIPVPDGVTVIEGLSVGEVLIRKEETEDSAPGNPAVVVIGVQSRTEGVVNLNQGGEDGSVSSSVQGAKSSNIESYAQTQKQESKDVKVQLEVIPRSENEVDGSSVEGIGSKVKEMFQNVEDTDVVTEYLEIDLTKYVDSRAEGNINDTEAPLEIELQYDKSKVMETPVVIRTHDGTTKVFDRLGGRPASAADYVDATYYVGDGSIYLYSQYFSDFAIVYTTSKTHYITIDTGTGETISQVVAEGSKIVLPDDLVKDGYHFTGWSDEPEGGSTWNPETDTVSADMKLYAVWERAVSSVSASLDQSKSTLTKIGETTKIAVSITPDEAVNKKVTFTSNNPGVATVDEDGKVIAVGNGTAVITVTTEDGGKTAQITVTVAVPEETGDNSGSTTGNSSSTTGNNSSNATDNNSSNTTSDNTGSTSAEKAEQKVAELALNEGLKIDQKGSKIKICWGRVKAADGYEVYVTYCGMTHFGKAAVTVKSNKIVSAGIKKINGKKINLKKNFKLYVVAYKLSGGKKVVIAKTIIGHIVGRKNLKFTNVKKVTVNKSKTTVKVGKTSKIKAKTVLVDKSKKQLSNAHAAEFRYVSSNKKIATVNKKGKIKGVSAGTCTVYVYARNGYAKKVKVTVN